AREPRPRRAGSPAAGVLAHASIPAALEVASACYWLGLAPVANREDRHLFALEQFLAHERVTATPCRLQAGVELCLRSADEHALSGREPVDLDDTRRPRDREPFRRRHAGRSHDVLGEARRALGDNRGSDW